MTKIPGWGRVLLILTALPHLATGAWATLAPANWFEHYPGFGPPLAAALLPFNKHLVGDVGVGFLAVGVVLLLAALIGERVLTLAAAATLFVFTAPHLVFHALNPAPGISPVEELGGLVASVIVPFLLLLAVRPTKGA